jgi:hypothetical protein
VPLSLKWLKIMQEVNYFCLAWNAIDAYLIAVIGVVYEGTIITGFVLGNGCDSINYALQHIVVASGVLPPDQGTCFFVATRLLSTLWYLIYAALATTICARTVSSIAERVIHEREGCDDDADSNTCDDDRPRSTFYRLAESLHLIKTIKERVLQV